jgi:hypothetical protein
MPQGSETIRLSYIKELTYNITPSGNMTLMRFNSETFNGKPTTKESAEVRSDAQPSGQRIVGLESGGGINAELAPCIAHQDFIAAAMRGTWGGTLTTGVVSQSINDTTKKIARLAGSYITDGFSVGDLVKLSGFATAANNTIVQLSAVSALELTYVGSSALVTEAASATAVVTVPDYIDWGTTEASFTIAKDFLDLTDKSLTYTGQRVGAMSLDAKYGDIAMVSFTIAGSGYDVPATPITDGRTLVTGGAEDSLNATSDLGLIMIDGVQTDYAIEDISIKLDNSLLPINGIGTLGAINQRSTGLKLSITMGVYLEDSNFDFHAKKLAQTALAITYFMRDANGKGYGFQIPAAQFSFDDAASSGRGAVAKLSLTGTAKNDATFGNTFRIYKLV